MFSRFTASARRVMQRAFREAKRWHHDFVGTEHLLYGLLCDADGPAVTLLHDLRADPDLMLRKVELSLMQHDAGMAMEKFPLSPASKRVFRRAADEAAGFQHQMVGPEHLLLGLLHERDGQAAQILFAHGVAWDATHKAVSQLPQSSYREIQIQADDKRIPLGDNPSADELERWIAAPITVDVTAEPMQAEPHESGARSPLPHLVESQLHLTQLAFGSLAGYAFGHWLAGWAMGLVLALLGIGLAWWRNIWVGMIVGVTCGLFITPLYHPDLMTPLVPMLIGMLGAVIGVFLGDWQFPTNVLPGKYAKDEEPTHDEIQR